MSPFWDTVNKSSKALGISCIDNHSIFNDKIEYWIVLRRGTLCWTPGDIYDTPVNSGGWIETTRIVDYIVRVNVVDYTATSNSKGVIETRVTNGEVRIIHVKHTSIVSLALKEATIVYFYWWNCGIYCPTIQCSVIKVRRVKFTSLSDVRQGNNCPVVWVLTVTVRVGLETSTKAIDYVK